MVINIGRLRQYRKGAVADRSVAYARVRAHEVFDEIWHKGYMTRREAYSWLAREFGREVHMKTMTSQECQRVIDLVNDLLNGLYGVPD